jgi:hypothetical protein
MVGQAIGRAVESAGPDLDRLQDNLSTWFHDWAAEGFFHGVELAAAPVPVIVNDANRWHCPGGG